MTTRDLRARWRNAKTRLFEPELLSQAEQTPFEVIEEIDELVKLRYYPPLTDATIPLASGDVLEVKERTARTPIVLVSPLAVNMAIYDLFPNRSLVRYLRARGFEVYLVDWGRPRRRHDHHGLSTYFAEYLPRVLDKVRAHSGSKRLSLHGWSFGGLFCLCYAALGTDPDIANLVLVASPFDYFKNGTFGQVYQRLSPSARWLSRTTGFGVHQAHPGAFRTNGLFNSLTFKLMTPLSTAQNYWELLKNMDDEAMVRSHATNGAVLDDMVAYPGRVNQDTIHYLMFGNVLAHDRLPMEGSRGSFANVKASVLNITGSSDVLVTTACSKAMQSKLGSRDATFMTIEAGHISIVSSARSQKETWGAIADWLLARDG